MKSCAICHGPRAAYDVGEAREPKRVGEVECLIFQAESVPGGAACGQEGQSSAINAVPGDLGEAQRATDAAGRLYSVNALQTTLGLSNLPESGLDPAPPAADRQCAKTAHKTARHSKRIGFTSPTGEFALHAAMAPGRVLRG